MTYELLALLINTVSMICSILLIYRILGVTPIKWRYYYLWVLSVLSVFRSFVVVVERRFGSTNRYEQIGFVEYSKFFLFNFSQYSRIIGLPLFIAATFVIVLHRYSIQRINKLYFWLLVLLIALLCIITTIYLSTGEIVCQENICTWDLKRAYIAAHLHVITSLLSITSIFGLSIILWHKRRMESSTKYLIFASMYYSTIPLFVFMFYLVYLSGNESIIDILPLQRVSTFLILLGILLFERKVGSKRKALLLKVVLAFKALRDIFKNWLDLRNYRKEFLLVELYEKIENCNNEPNKIKEEDCTEVIKEKNINVETIEDLTKLKLEIVCLLNGKFTLFKETKEYTEVLNVSDNLSEIDVALLNN